MDPETHKRLYGPWRPAPPASAHPAVTLLTVLLGAATALSMAWLTLLVGLVTLWGAAAEMAVGGLVVGYASGAAIGAGLLTALAFAPPVRRMTPGGRRLLLAATACPVPAVLAAVTWLSAG